MTVRITFEAPSRKQSGVPTTAHERDLDGVPPTTAKQMSRDFVDYQRDPTEEKRKKLYTYEKEGRRSAAGEALVALDFGEVLTLEAAEVESAPRR